MKKESEIREGISSINWRCPTWCVNSVGRGVFNVLVGQDFGRRVGNEGTLNTLDLKFIFNRLKQDFSFPFTLFCSISMHDLPLHVVVNKMNVVMF